MIILCVLLYMLLKVIDVKQNTQSWGCGIVDIDDAVYAVDVLVENSSEKIFTASLFAPLFQKGLISKFVIFE